MLADEKDPPPFPPTKTADSQPSFRNNLPLISACFFCHKTLKNMICSLRCRNMKYTVIFIVVLIPVLKNFFTCMIDCSGVSGMLFPSLKTNCKGKTSYFNTHTAEHLLLWSYATHVPITNTYIYLFIYSTYNPYTANVENIPNNARKWQMGFNSTFKGLVWSSFRTILYTGSAVV